MRIRRLPSDYRPGFGEALVDPSVLVPLERWFGEEKPLGLAGLLALFQFSEGVVLNDTLIVPDSWRYPPERATKAGLWPTELQWLGDLAPHTAIHGDLISFSIFYGIDGDAGFDRAVSFCMGLDSAFGHHWRRLAVLPFEERRFSLWVVISDTLNMFHRVWAWNCPFVANPFWEQFFVLEEARPKALPRRLYEALDAGLRARIEELQREGAPTELYIPPIPAIVLDRCAGTAESYWRELLGLRDEFGPTRRKLKSYHAAMANPGDKPLRHLLRAHKECFRDVEAALRRVGEPTDRRKVLELWEAVASFDVPEMGLQAALTVGKIATLASAAAEWLRLRSVRGRARIFFDIHGKVMRIRRYGDLLQTKLGVDPHELALDMQIYQELSAKVTSLRRAAGRREGAGSQQLED